MAWNSANNKSAKGAFSFKTIGPGAPVAQNPAFVGKPYRDMWDVERAYREGFQKVTWVTRCIDAIAGNQARLPIILRKENSRDGEIITGKRAFNNPLIDILNTKANMGENAFIFRYRLSSQLLMSSRGAFIEKVKGRDGGVIALNLLPPQHTAPIPHPKTFISGYEVAMPTGEKIILKPEDVLWIRRPHPLDPYLSLTPMESAGIAIEIENLAKVYNRNYLLNDGRPGGILVVKGEIDEDDKDELRNRFRGNLTRAGATTVIAADDGVDFVDTSSNPRDASYVQMRQIQKEEILAAFGVPESVIGNASGRTFSNAAEEHRVFWNETMLPHLDLLARALDELDDVNYVDFDTSNVPILILYKQERSRYFMDEFNVGLLSTNEYRTATGRKTVKSDLADSLLMNPNLTPIANTEKEMEQPQAAVPGMPGAPGMPGMPGAAPEMPMAPDGTMPSPLAVQDGSTPQPDTMSGALAAEAAAPQNTVAPAPEGQLSANSFGEIETKSENLALQRWTEILNRSLERTIERQQRVVMEKATGVKAKKSISTGNLDVSTIFVTEIWNKQMDEDIKPILSTIIQESNKTSLSNKSLQKEDVEAYLDSQMNRIKQINDETYSMLNKAYLDCLPVIDGENRNIVFRADCVSTFSNLLGSEIYELAEQEARRAWQFGN